MKNVVYADLPFRNPNTSEFRSIPGTWMESGLNACQGLVPLPGTL